MRFKLWRRMISLNAQFPFLPTGMKGFDWTILSHHRPRSTKTMPHICVCYCCTIWGNFSFSWKRMKKKKIISELFSCERVRSQTNKKRFIAMRYDLRFKLRRIEAATTNDFCVDINFESISYFINIALVSGGWAAALPSIWLCLQIENTHSSCAAHAFEFRWIHKMLFDRCSAKPSSSITVRSLRPNSDPLSSSAWIDDDDAVVLQHNLKTGILCDQV